MKVEVWSDYACPFCYIGKRRFEGGLKQFAHSDGVDVEFKSFQLDPSAPRDNEHDMHTLLAKKYGMSVEQAKQMNAQMTQQAKEVGLDYHIDTLIPTNTFDAHRLTHYAKTQGKMEALKERLLKAYFTDSLHLGDHKTLVKLAVEAGLDEEGVRTVLQSDDFGVEVNQDQQIAAQIGVTGVPFYVFNQKYAVSGAQPSEVFLEVLNKVWEEEQEKLPLKVLTPENGGNEDPSGNCGDGSCSI
ncbi:DsbA family oxidoreductase [Falsibacillus pallidus]|uniref:Putative DsbA family dithiol-disulfide isomerase n=1 Tax=Falsibacillus pallidus TaxID=493781 RepID=A0A370G9Q5_9BACI|nr:DsbA family oxidoreductase [Falsibacillus pallidus]RDI39916.1 putative DsbA family dithiol-disulfide isomerase [Falsibacillus pallidus]